MARTRHGAVLHSAPWTAVSVAWWQQQQPARHGDPGLQDSTGCHPVSRDRNTGPSPPTAHVPATMETLETHQVIPLPSVSVWVPVLEIVTPPSLIVVPSTLKI